MWVYASVLFSIELISVRAWICISPQLSICYFVFDSFERAKLHFTAQSVVGRAFVDGHTLYLSCSPDGICGQGASYGTVLHRHKRSVLAQNRTL